MNKITSAYSDRDYPLEILLKSVGEGWGKLVTDLIEGLFKLGWGGRIYQAKEKFGGLRFYARLEGPTKESTIEMERLISEAEELSYKTCEACGKPGKPRAGGWIKTLCDEHA